jgi:anaerobic C4-dicarboxylate transporter
MEISYMILIQLAIVLICIFIGARMSGIGLGVMGTIGLLIAGIILKSILL